MKRAQVESIKDLEAYMNKRAKIKLAGEYKRKPMRKTLYKAMMSSQRPKTLRPGGRVQCIRGKYRSIYDLILLVKYYYPKDTVIDVLKGIKEVYSSSKNPYPASLAWCPDVNKSNFRAPCSKRMCVVRFESNSFRDQGFDNFRKTFKNILKDE